MKQLILVIVMLGMFGTIFADTPTPIPTKTPIPRPTNYATQCARQTLTAQTPTYSPTPGTPPTSIPTFNPTISLPYYALNAGGFTSQWYNGVTYTADDSSIWISSSSNFTQHYPIGNTDNLIFASHNVATYGDLSYSISVLPDYLWDLELDFATYRAIDTGNIDIYVNATPVATINPYQLAGKFKATSIMQQISSYSGSVVITLHPEIDGMGGAFINGLALYAVPSTITPTITPTITQTMLATSTPINTYTPVNTPTITATSTPLIGINIDCGNNLSNTTINGITWLKDVPYIAGLQSGYGGPPTFINSATPVVYNDKSVILQNRQQSTSTVYYGFANLETGYYSINMLFADYISTTANSNLITVTISDGFTSQSIMTDVDIFALAGSKTEYDVNSIFYFTKSGLNPLLVAISASKGIPYINAISCVSYIP